MSSIIVKFRVYIILRKIQNNLQIIQRRLHLLVAIYITNLSHTELNNNRRRVWTGKVFRNFACFNCCCQTNAYFLCIKLAHRLLNRHKPSVIKQFVRLMNTRIAGSVDKLPTIVAMLRLRLWDTNTLFSENVMIHELKCLVRKLAKLNSLQNHGNSLTTLKNAPEWNNYINLRNNGRSSFDSPLSTNLKK